MGKMREITALADYGSDTTSNSGHEDMAPVKDESELPLFEEKDIMPPCPGPGFASLFDHFRRRTLHAATGMKVSKPGRWRKRVLTYRASLVVLSLIILILLFGL